MQTWEFGEENLVYKVYLLIASMHITILYHYLVFGAWEANMIASGLGYRPKTEKEPEDYNTLRSVIMFKFSTGLTGTGAVNNWNMNSAHWMKYYI